MSDLIVKDFSYLTKHEGMLEYINSNMPAINKASNNFYKTQSQFMDNNMTLSHLTPARNARQILAQVEKCKKALREHHFSTKKNEVELKKLRRKFEEETDELERELLIISMDEIKSSMESIKGYVSGSVRQVTNYIEQYNALCASKGISDFTESDFEEEEEAYHIMKAFEQALGAARSRAGMIDEGNHIYFTQIGINGTAAQYYVTNHLKKENQLIKDGKLPTIIAQIKFFEEMVQLFKGSSKLLTTYKGLNGSSDLALLKQD